MSVFVRGSNCLLFSTSLSCFNNFLVPQFPVALDDLNVIDYNNYILYKKMSELQKLPDIFYSKYICEAALIYIRMLGGSFQLGKFVGF